LELARVRHARGLLAAEETAAASRRDADGYPQCESMQDLSAGRQSVSRLRLGAQRAQLRSGADAQARGPAGHYPQIDRADREILRHAAARLVRPRPNPDPRYARPPRPSRDRIYRRLGARRRAGDAENRARSLDWYLQQTDRAA